MDRILQQVQQQVAPAADGGGGEGPVARVLKQMNTLMTAPAAFQTQATHPFLSGKCHFARETVRGAAAKCNGCSKKCVRGSVAFLCLACGRAYCLRCGAPTEQEDCPAAVEQAGDDAPAVAVAGRASVVKWDIGKCVSCAKPFSVWSWRYPCGVCGFVFCSDCCRWDILIEEGGGERRSRKACHWCAEAPAAIQAQEQAPPEDIEPPSPRPPLDDAAVDNLSVFLEDDSWLRVTPGDMSAFQGELWESFRAERPELSEAIRRCGLALGNPRAWDNEIEEVFGKLYRQSRRNSRSVLNTAPGREQALLLVKRLDKERPIFRRRTAEVAVAFGVTQR